MLQKILVIAATLAMAPALLAQTSRTELKTPAGRFPLEVTAEYLGMAAGKTVVRIRLSSAELSKAAASKGIRAFSGELRGTFSRGSDMVQAFRYPVSGDVMDGKTFTYSFLRPIAPGNYRLKLVVAEPGGREIGEGAVDLMVPEVGLAFRPEMAPADADTPKLKLLPPPREAPVGLLRLDAQIEPPITKVAFYLGEKLLLARTRPPYSVEIDLGNLPLRQTVRAVGYDDTGKVIDEDAWAINEGAARVAVRVLPQPDPSAGKVRVRVAVQSIAGGIAKLVELFLDERKIGSWTHGPYVATIPYDQYARGNFLRATAVSEDGREANDIRMLKGPSTTVESVRVDVVQLHVSALDKSGHFVKGLAREDFSIQEDGRSQTISGFEIADKLPLTVGLVVDGSGSMEKGLPFVHDASAELFKNLIRDKDRGFVIECRERPRFLQELTGNSGDLQRAAQATRAEGATA